MENERMLMNDYARILTDGITNIAESQSEKIEEAATLLCDTLCHDGLIYVFGCGHSHMLAEETFYRAGGLACVYPLFNEPLMLHESASLSSHLERESGWAEKVLSPCVFGPHDALICVSTSGVNGVPVEVAAEARRRGVKVIGITSSAYDEDAPRNAENMHLWEVCDVWADNAAPHGDACLQPVGLPVKMTPTSTVFSAFIINSMLAQAVQMALARGVEPPVFLSGNIEGGHEYNRKLIERYKSRVPCL